MNEELRMTSDSPFVKSLKNTLDFFLHSNLFISFCATTITVETYLLIHAQINWLYISFVFFSTIVLYNFPSLFFSPHPNLPPQEEGMDSARDRWIVENRSALIILSVVSFIAVAITIFFFPLRFILLMIPNAVLAFAYFFPQTHLRSIVGLKAAAVAFVWIMVTAFYPLLLFLVSNVKQRTVFTNENCLLITERFLFILPLCIIFNVRDMEADRIAGVRTIPVVYGAKTTIITCLVSLLLFSALVFFNREFSAETLALTASATVSGILILKSSPDKDDYFYSFWMDGMIILQAGLVVGIGDLYFF